MKADDVFSCETKRIRAEVSRLFVGLLSLQWIASIGLALFVSPQTWAGSSASPHPHVFAAIVVGGLITVFPVVLGIRRPEHPATPFVLASAQTCWSGLLIHLCGGRIEAHFHVFGSLAFIAFYRDWRVLIPATVVVAADHFVRGLVWPESVYGITNPEWWRTLEHAVWVVFIDVFLIKNCMDAQRALRERADHDATLQEAERELRALASTLEQRVEARTHELLDVLHQVERVEAIVEQSSDCVAMYEIDGDMRRVGYLNASARESLGDEAWFCELASSSLREPLELAIEHDTWLGEVELQSFSGSSVPAEVLAQVHRTPEGAVEFLSITVRDLRERKKMEADLLQAQKLESIGQLAAGIAHEINTPMQYIGDNTHFLKTAFARLVGVVESVDELIVASEGMAELDSVRSRVQTAIKKGKIRFLRERVPRSIETTLEGIESVSSIVRAMKAFSHPGSTEKTHTDINAAIETTITVSKNEWKYHATIERDLDPAVCSVLALPAELNQVLLNIIVNAAHAIEAHKPSGELGVIRIRTCIEGDDAVIRIADDGCGMPPHVIAKVFDPFFTTKEVGKGTGQGLAIAHRIIVDKHGGALAVQSEPGGGTEFTIRLPLTTEELVRAAE